MPMGGVQPQCMAFLAFQMHWDCCVIALMALPFIDARPKGEVMGMRRRRGGTSETVQMLSFLVPQVVRTDFPLPV